MSIKLSSANVKAVAIEFRPDFRIRTRPGIVTALHGVAGCGDIRVVGEAGAIQLLGAFKIVAVILVTM